MKRYIHDYAQALYDLASAQPSQLNELIKRFLVQLRLDRNHKLLPLIVDELDRIDAESHQNLIVKVTTAQALTDSQAEQLTTSLLKVYRQAKSVQLRKQVDPTILGGIRLQIGDQTIDHTIKFKLDHLAARL